VSYQYRITIESMSGDPNTQDPKKSLSFEVNNHDDILVIAERIQKLNWLNASDAYSTVIGLKLLAEVTLKYRKDPLFNAIAAPLRDFIQGLKKKGNATQTADVD